MVREGKTLWTYTVPRVQRWFGRCRRNFSGRPLSFILLLIIGVVFIATSGTDQQEVHHQCWFQLSKTKLSHRFANYFPEDLRKFDLGNDQRREIVMELYKEQITKWEDHIDEMNYTTLGLETLTFPLEEQPQSAGPPCLPEYSTTLIAKVRDDLWRTGLDLDRVTKDVLPGGLWSPGNCSAKNIVAVVVPYRNIHGLGDWEGDRREHLVNFLAYMIPILKSQLLNFRIIVTEQLGNEVFNKARIMNAAFEFLSELNPYINCVIFHDVDLMPQSGAVRYDCDESPRHLAAYFDGGKFKLLYDYLLGGAVAITPAQFLAINGYSSLYWGWGGEDDDLGLRVQRGLGLKIHRPPNNKRPYRYLMLQHKSSAAYPKTEHRALIDSAHHRYLYDGYRHHMWKTVNITMEKLYYHLGVDVGPETQFSGTEPPNNVMKARRRYPRRGPSKKYNGKHRVHRQ